jgi:hypothetical protein
MDFLCSTNAIRKKGAAVAAALMFCTFTFGCSREPPAVIDPASVASHQVDPTRSTNAGTAQPLPIKRKTNRWASHVDAATTPGADDNPVATDSGATAKVTKDGYRNLDWLEMMPRAEVDALAHPDQQVLVDHLVNKRAKQAGSSHVVLELDGQKARLEGYVVPIEADDEGNMTEFFIVPFYGACIHVPPPPPNQIVYAKLAKGIKTPESWQAFWFKGTLRTQSVSNRVAGAAYSMDNPTLVPWDG